MGRQKLQHGILPMEKIRQVLRLKELGFNQRAIHRATGLARSSVQEYLRTAELHGLDYAQASLLNDEALKAALSKKTPGRSRKETVEPDFLKVHTELFSRKGMTLELLWKEWNETYSGGYSYSTFCRRYREHARRTSVVMRREYEPGELMLSDYAGATLSYLDDKGQGCPVQIFVAILGASNRIYTEATGSQKIVHWINSHIRAFSYFGGVTTAVAIDNLKSGVTHSHRYEPEINRSFEEFAAHYGTTIFPMRANKPRDKAKVEKAVQDIERAVLAPLRHACFRSIEEINTALRPLLETLNNRNMKDYGASRNELFDKLDRSALKPLPAMPFVVATYKRAKVSLDYHISLEQHFYSVPYTHVKKEVWVKITEKLIEVFLENERIASHPRSSLPYRFSTIEAHMLPAHKAVKSWSANNFLTWAHTVGGATEKLVNALLNSPRYKEQSFRSILGIQRLHQHYGAALVEQAAFIACQRKHHSQRALKQILETLSTKEKALNQQEQQPIVDGNIRGGSYYH